MSSRTYQETLDALNADTRLSNEDRDRLSREAADKEYGSDPFDVKKYREAAGVAYEFTKKKMEDSGAQERETIGKGATEQRTSAQQGQEFKQRDEERDYGQAQRAYRY